MKLSLSEMKQRLENLAWVAVKKPLRNNTRKINSRQGNGSNTCVIKDKPFIEMALLPAMGCTRNRWLPCRRHSCRYWVMSAEGNV